MEERIAATGWRRAVYWMEGDSQNGSLGRGGASVPWSGRGVLFTEESGRSDREGVYWGTGEIIRAEGGRTWEPEDE